MKRKVLLTLSNFRTWANQNKFLVAYISGVATWLIIQIIGGVLSNSAYKYWNEKIFPWLLLPTSLDNLTLIGYISLFFVIGCLMAIVFLRNRYQRQPSISVIERSQLIQSLRGQEIVEYHHLTNQINSHIQTILDQTENLDVLDKLIDDFFLSIYRCLGPDIVNGGGILLPDEHSPELLSFWKMGPDQMISPKHFYIGPDNSDSQISRARGVAGYVYLENEARIVNIVDRINAVADTAEFHRFDMERLGQPRYIVPYDAFICLPIHFQNKIVGVLSIESQKLHSFDTYSVDLLQPIADQLGTILYLFKKI